MTWADWWRRYGGSLEQVNLRDPTSEEMGHPRSAKGCTETFEHCSRAVAHSDMALEFGEGALNMRS